MYRKLQAKMSPFSLYVLLYIMVVRISVDFIRKKMFLTEAVFILNCCCALLRFISNMQYIIIYFKMILPENEFSLLKGVNSQPQFGHLNLCITIDQKIFIFLYFTLLFTQLRFLHSSNRPSPSCILSLCQNKSKCKSIHMICTHRFISQ